MEFKFEAGDYVRLKLAREEVKGIILESHDKSILLVKLDSGYNIGIPKENVYGLDIVKKGKFERKEIKFEHKKGLSKIGLIITGGTIASKLDSRTGAVSALTDVGEFRRFYPGLFEMADVKIEVPFMKLSENMGFDEWKIIAETAAKMLNDREIKGVVIAHGTDTLHYTSAALSFFLGNIGKPVVLTYAQRSIDRGSSDADLNLRCAARFALGDAAGVYVVGHADINDDFCYVLIGTKVRKMHTSRRDAFKPINANAIAKVWSEKIEFLSGFKARYDCIVELDATFSDKIALLKAYPGQKPDILENYKKEGYKGLVIEVFGIGNLPDSWLPTIKKLLKEGFIICGAAQTIYGRLHAGVYSTGKEIERAGVIFLGDMLAETAFVKLGWVLGHRTWKDKIGEKMLENVAGELNELITD